MSNQGDILSYSPDLSIYSEPSSGVTLDSTSSTLETFLADVDLSANKSNCAYEFELHAPSKKVQALVNTLEMAKNLKDSIEDSLSKNEYGSSYLSSGDEAESSSIFAQNSTDLEFGTTDLEIYKVVEDLVDEMNGVLTLYAQCIFGKDVDLDAIPSIESEYINKIEKYETERKYEKVNYFNLYYDTQISYLVGEYADDIYRFVYNLSTIKDVNKTNFTPDTNSRKIIKASFDKNNTLLQQDLNKAANCGTDVTTALNNIFLTKQEVNTYLDTFANIYQLDGVSADFLQMKQENINSLEQKLDNLVKTVMYSGIAKDDIQETLKKKSKYRSFFVA
jgi:hypothetical protein